MTEFQDTPMRIGRVVLTVRDLDGVGRFYRDVIGLRELARDAAAALLGVGDNVLLELHRDAEAQIRSPRDAGLFHTAFLLPSRADLGRWTKHAVESRVAIQGASDHVVSEALYLADPEGNGIEIYADRPRALWQWSDGAIVVRTDPLDVPDLLKNAGTAPWIGVPEGTTVGHVHLQVGSIAPADAFYGGVLGFDVMARYAGASFFGSGGYHHQLAANIWNSRNAAPRIAPATGLSDLAVRVSDPKHLAAIGAKARDADVAMEEHSSGFRLRDPWGTSLTLTAPVA